MTAEQVAAWCQQMGPEPEPKLCRPEPGLRRYGCGHPLADHTPHLRCRTCGTECGLDCG